MIYLDIPNVKGAVTAKGYVGQILIHGYYTAARLPMSQFVGNAAYRTVGQLHYWPLALQKSMDSASVELFDYFHTAEVIAKIQFNHVATNAIDCYFQATYYDVIFSHYIETADSDGIIETYQLFFTKVEKRLIPIAANSKADSPKTTGYDLIQATKL